MTDQGPYRFYKPENIKHRRSRWIWIGIGVVVAIFIIWLLMPHGDQTAVSAGGPGAAAGRGGGAPGAGGGRGGRGGRGGAGAPTTVGWARAVNGDAPIYIYALGTVTPTQTVTVRTQISGYLMSVAFKEGQTVSKGQVLAQIDPRPYEQQLLQAEGTLAKDQAQLANAKVDLQRYDTLVTEDSVAKQTRDTQAALVRQLDGQIKTDQAAVSAQKLNLIYCRITSPVTGRVGLRQVDPGNYVTPGDTNGIVVVTEVNPIDVLFTLPEDSLSQVNKRVASGAHLEAAAFDRTQKTQLSLGQLLTLDNQVDTTTGTVRAKARYDNTGGALFPNQFVNIRLLVDTLHNTILIPTSAILRGSQGLFVWVYDPMGRTVEQRTVQTGPAAGDNTAITSGLDPSEIVVTDGSDRLRDAQRVFLQNDCLEPDDIKRIQARAAAGAGSGAGGARRGGAPDGGAAQAPASEPKTLFNLFGLLGSKTRAQPGLYSAMACKPGQVSVAKGGGGNGSSTAQATPVNGASAPDSTPAHGGRRSHGDAPPTPGTSTQPMAAAGGGQAQTPSSPGGGQGPQAGGQGGPGHMSARMQAMFGPLNLDAAQQAKVQTIVDANRPKMMAAYQSGDMNAAKAARQAMDAQIDAVLRPDQKAKMAEIRAQMQARRAAGGGGQ